MAQSKVGVHIRAEHGGPHSVPGGSARGVIDFSSSIGPLAAPRKVISAIGQGPADALAYPDPDSAQLCNAIAVHHKIGQGRVIVGNGATEIIYEYCRALIKPGTHILVQAPTFAEYESASRLCGAKVTRYRTMDVSTDIAEFIDKIPRKGCVFVCNPNNPTGALISHKLVLEIATEAERRGSQLLVDECFIELCVRDESVIRNVVRRENLFVLRSFTKSFGIPGVRIGYGAGRQHLVDTMAGAKVPWSVSASAQRAGMAALKCQGHAAKSARAARKEVGYLYTAINAIDGMSAMPSEANFVLARSSKYTGLEIRSRLLNKKILVRECGSFVGLDASFIRIGVRTRKENTALIRALGSL